MIKRIDPFKYLGDDSCFFWGPRQTGKTTLLKEMFPDAPYYDLLLSNEYERLIRDPAILREELLANPPKKEPVVIDEIQKIPQLLDEIHWLIVNKGIQFLLCGSSPRKLIRGGGNLLGGRALRFEFFPFVFKELKDFDLLRALNNGLIPRHYLVSNAKKRIQAYVGDYLREEIAAEALSRNVPAFSRFLHAAAFSNGEIINYKNIARECGISAPTVKSYYQILEDTLLARFVSVYRKRPKRRVITAPKFYFFDVGIVNYLLNRHKILYGSETIGKAFEHFIFQELTAHTHYSDINYPIYYWRTTSQLEVDFILGDCDVAIEVKAGNVRSHHLRGLKVLQDEYRKFRSIIVSLDTLPRKIGKIEVIPYAQFLERLWGGKII